MPGKLFLAAFLMAHAAIHASFLAPPPPATANGPAWPFELGRSVVLTPMGVDPVLLRLVGIVLVAVVLGAFGLAALATLGLGPRTVVDPALVAGAVGSLALLVLYFNPWFLLGIGIDLAIIWLTLGDWAPESISA